MGGRRGNHAVHDDDADRGTHRMPVLLVVLLVALAVAVLALLPAGRF